MNCRGAVAAMILLAATPVAARAADKPYYGDWGFDLTAMDRSATPGDDFNRYAKGAWLVRTPIPPTSRVIGPMRNIDAWYAAFWVKPGEGYYLAPDQRVRIW